MSNSKVKRRKLWDEGNMDKAIEMVYDGYTIYEASKQMQIPYNTLRRRVLPHDSSPKMGRPGIFTSEDEDQLVRYIKFLGNCGNPATPLWIRETATRLAIERGRHSQGLLSEGWLYRFMGRHPELTVRTPSLLDPGRSSMSRSSVMDCFFREVKELLSVEGILDQPSRIYNIDESWFSPKDAKLQKVVIEKGHKPYKIFDGVQEHITFSMCVAATGDFLPPMFTFKSSLPSGSEYHTLGPVNALYTCSDSGHIDTQLYLKYIHYLEPFLNSERPVIIFQDNLGAHEDYDLVQFCVQHKIILQNFPAKVSHLIQPLDKVFGPFKVILQKKKQKARLLQQKYIAKGKVPIVTRFAMEGLSRQVIISGFEKTGIYPFNREVITDVLLVGNEVVPATDANNNITEKTQFEDVYQPDLFLGVYDDSGQEITSKLNGCSHKCQSTQTSPIKYLPCSVCIKNEVEVHPAVTAGIVDLEMARVFLQDGSNELQAKRTKRRVKRDCTKGRCLTHESEVQRLKEKKEKIEKDLITKKEKLEQRASKKLEKIRITAQRKVERQQEKERRDQMKLINAEGKVGLLSKRNTCDTCKCKVHSIEDITICVLCSNKYHKMCLSNSHDSFVTVCIVCANK